MLKKLLAIFWNPAKKLEKLYTEENLKAVEFTDKTDQLIEKLVNSDPDKTNLLAELRKYSVFYKDGYKEECPERFIFSILKISIRSGSFQEEDLLVAMDLAMLDYRDLLGGAGFASDVQIHNKWAEKILNAE